MSSRTEIPAYNPEEFADAVDSVHRDTRVPAFDVGLLARASDVEVTQLPFDLADVPILGTTSTGSEAIDHRAAFLMLNIDGRSSFETVTRLSHVPEAEAHAALITMLAVGLIAIRGQSANDDRPAPTKHESGMWSRESVNRALASNEGERWTFAVQR